MPGLLKVANANITNLTNKELNDLSTLVAKIESDIQNLQSSVNEFNSNISSLQQNVDINKAKFDAIVGGASRNLDTLEGNIENIEQALHDDDDVDFALRT